jgi:hypothetical protein
MASADEIVVGANGKVWVAETTDPMPTDSDTALNVAWVDLGYVSEDGVTFTDSKEVESIGGWQSFYPIRRVVTSRDAMVSFVLRQWNEDSVALAFGGGAVTDNGGGEYEYNPPSPEDIDNRALVIEWTDGTKDYRLLFPSGMVTEAVETNIVRTSAADLPITFAATPASGADAYILFTNDPAFA